MSGGTVVGSDAIQYKSVWCFLFCGPRMEVTGHRATRQEITHRGILAGISAWKASKAMPPNLIPRAAFFLWPSTVASCGLAPRPAGRSVKMGIKTWIVEMGLSWHSLQEREAV